MKRHGLLCCALVLVGAAARGAEVRFTKIVIDRTFRSEGVAAADVNRDGRMDILAGDVWYEAPGWKMHEIRPVGRYDGTKGYSQCFVNFAQDVNRDGWTDSIIVGFPGAACHWYENPGRSLRGGRPGHWRERKIWRSVCNETPLFADLLGDGGAVLVFGFRPEGIMAWFGIPRDLEGPWDMHAVSGRNAPGTKRYAHGLGAGDVDGDGRCDILVTEGWWRAPADPARPDWQFHKAKLGPACADMIVYDVDGDGDGDILTSSAHNYGIWWHEQKRKEGRIEFERHEIHKGFSQSHAMIAADINGDGLKDLVTGKRYFAHNGKDPGGKEPAVLYWFELRRPRRGMLKYVPHKIDDDSGIGTQFQVCDFNRDRRLDIVTSNKKGVHLFLQEGRRRR